MVIQTVLIVDDIAENLYFLEVLLKGNGFDVRSAPNGAEALASARSNPPDLLISDILMPVMDGYALCRQWRTDERLKRIPFIFYTATFTDKKDEELGLELGADRYVIKPQDPVDFMAVVREVLSGGTSIADELSAGIPDMEEKLLRDYNDALFRKLEKKMADLEKANLSLQHLNDELDERVRQRTRELEDKVSELNAFTSAVSHDLRTPMRQLRSYCQVLMENLDGRLGKEDGHILEKIVQKSTAAMEMVDTLLDLARLGKAEVIRQEVDLSRLAAEVLKEFSTLEPERRYRFDVADGLTVKADRQLVRIVLTNLLGNAWKFTANRQEARIGLSAEPSADGTVFCISDNGVGFDMQNAHKLFVPFQRLHAQEEFVGDGIGLATVNSIVRSHGGRIWAESEPDCGARFCFTLGTHSAQT